MAYSSVQNYKEQAIKTMTSGELLVLLLNEATKNLRTASMVFDDGNIELFDTCLRRSKDIFFYLGNILDMQYEISEDLHAIYDFIGNEIMKAEFKKDKNPIDQVLPLVEDLRITWIEANKITTKDNA
ncbi:MAG: flagellar export chaperone FliS [Clostridia bacterium]|nr:flagellar export chaperone FliS [Clostridia bacterium]